MNESQNELELKAKWITFNSKLTPEQLIVLGQISIKVLDDAKDKSIGYNAVPLIIDQLNEEMKEIYRSC